MGRRYTGKTCRLLTMLCLTLAFFVVEIVVGYLTNSMALVADSFHMLSDVLALLIGFFSVRVARRRTTKNTFGWVRAEVLGALVNAVFLVALCFSILVEALKRLILVEPIHNPKLLLAVGAAGLVVNLIGLFLFHDHGHSHAHSHGQRGAHPTNAESREHLGSFDKLNLSGAKYIEGALADEDDYDQTGYDQYTAVDGSSDSETAIPTPITTIGGGGGQAKLLRPDGGSNPDGTGLIPNGSASSTRPILNDHNSPALNKSSGFKAKNRSTTKPTPRNSPSNDANVRADARRPESTDAKQAHKHGHGSHMSMRGVFLHVLGDALGSVVVVLSALAIMYFKGSWRFYVDPCMSVALVVIILGTTVPLLRESAFILLQTVPTHIEVEDLRRRLVDNIDGVLAVHEFHVWQLTGNRIIASAHIRCRNLVDYMKIAGKVKEFFHREGIHSTTIQPEFVEEFDQEERCLLQCRAPIVCAPKTCCFKNGDKPGENGTGGQAGATGNGPSGQADRDAIDLENFIRTQASAGPKATRLPPPPGSASRKNRNSTGQPTLTPKSSTNTPPSQLMGHGQYNPFLSSAGSDGLPVPASVDKSSSTIITFVPPSSESGDNTPGPVPHLISGPKSV